MSKRRKKKKSKPKVNHKMTLEESVQQKISSLNRVGVSKEDTCKELGTRFSPFIHSANTFDQYSCIARDFAGYCTTLDSTARTLRYCFKKGYARQYIQDMIDAGMSPNTIARATSALAKLFGVSCDEIHNARPSVRYKDFTRTRDYGEQQYTKDAARTDFRGETARFLRCCGIREVELTHLYGNCLENGEDGNLYMVISKDTCFTAGKKGCTCAAKGGRPRRILIAKQNEETVRSFIGRVQPHELVCPNVSDKLVIHGIRALFALDEYLRAAVDNLEDIREARVPSQRNAQKMVSRVYRTRDGKGREFDRLALRMVAMQLGHNRENVCVESYLWHL